MLQLPIEKKWFAMIVSGEKKEEYREIKPYWTKRFQSLGLLDENEKPDPNVTRIIELRNGYQKYPPRVCVKVRLFIRKGNEKWGAEPDKKYYVLRILEMGTVWNYHGEVGAKNWRK